jgi:hypothetical protein
MYNKKAELPVLRTVLLPHYIPQTGYASSASYEVAIVFATVTYSSRGALLGYPMGVTPNRGLLYCTVANFNGDT